MEVKKSPKADLERGKTMSVLMGFIVGLAVLYVGFEWSTQDVMVVDETEQVQDVIAEEEIEITRQENTPPPPPPPAAPAVAEVLTVVDDDVELADVEIASSEDDASAAQAETYVAPVVEEEEEEESAQQIFTVVEKQPEFPIVDIQVMRGVDPSLDKEAVRVIGTMPKWKPGEQRGKPVRVRFILPVQFRLQ